jgi:hypothetical protein
MLGDVAAVIAVFVAAFLTLSAGLNPYEATMT